MSYAKNYVTDSHKVFVQIDGVMHELRPTRQRFVMLPGDTLDPAPFEPLIGYDLKIARQVLRMALASIDARERARQAKEDKLSTLTPRERAKREEREEALRENDHLYEIDPGRFDRAPRGYYKRREERLKRAKSEHA